MSILPTLRRSPIPIFQILAWTLFAVVIGCSSSQTVKDEYHEEIHGHPQLAHSPSTTIVFLVDGFSSVLLSDSITKGRVTRIQEFFGITQFFPLGRASFPTLTFPNLTSILTGEVVSVHGVNGNRIVNKDGSITNFEDIGSWDALNKRVHGQTVFANLSRAGETSVNYSYPFSDTAGKTVDQKENISAAVDYLERDYAAVDHETFASLRTLLEKTKPEHWPRLIFVHFIGVDSLSHEFGPDDERTKKYVEDLDEHLAPIFESIRLAEGAGHVISTILTADHGFAAIDNDIPIKEEVEKISSQVRVIADNRVAPVLVPAAWTPSQRHDLANQLRSISHVDWVMEKDGAGINIYNSSGLQGRIDLAVGKCQYGDWTARFNWQGQGVRIVPPEAASKFYCPESFDRGSSLTNITFMVPALVEYFIGPTAPAIVMVAGDQSEFSGHYKGNHGGLTAAEVLVPLLSRNADLPPSLILPTSQLMRRLNLLKGD